MKPYSTFSAEDLACDDDFFKWVKYPERYPGLQMFWDNWLLENPSRKDIVEEARYLVLSVVEQNQYLKSESRQKEVWDRIVSTTDLSVSRPIPFWRQWYAKAAVILLALGAGWFFLKSSPGENYASLAEDAGVGLLKHINNAGLPKTIILSDGTSIILQPHSILEYPQAFGPDAREVYLNGEAFFEVTRDPNRPFLVHAGDIVTRVLGTSFTVRNLEREGNVLVQVKTGKVSVFRAGEEWASSNDDEKGIDGVVLMPNQQVLYERLEMKMTKSLVENPDVLVPLAKQEFEFADAPIKDVFAAIEEAYGVDIVFDEQALSSCYLNASLTDVALYDKLKLICRGINTTYEIIDSHIIIYGKGCAEDITNPNPI